MSVADVRFAGQIVAQGREPLFFDDLGCLKGFLANGTDVPAMLQVYVADHLTREWVKAESAVFTKVEGLDTPMGSGVIAHASPQSRDSDPAARGGVAVPPLEFLPPRR
jgi:copper chaperone NosL